MTKLPALLGLIASLGITSPLLAAPACDDPNPLRFSISPTVKMNDLLAQYQPLVQQLENNLGRKVTLIQPTSYNTVIVEMLSGNIDLASMGPASYASARDRDPGITAFATWTFKGGTYVEAGSYNYHSLLVVLNKSKLKSVTDLKGKSVVLSDPASTSGAVIPREEFPAAAGNALESHFSKVSYSGSHDRSLEMLKNGYVDAAFVAAQRVDDAMRKGWLASDEVRVVWRSRPIPHDPFVLRNKLCPALQEKIRQTFFSNSSSVQRLLSSFHAERFVPVGDEDYSYIRSVLLKQKQ